MIQLLRKCLYIFQLKVIPQSVKNLVLCGYWNHITFLGSHTFNISDLTSFSVGLQNSWSNSLQLEEYDGDQDQDEREANTQGQEEVEAQVVDAQEVIRHLIGLQGASSRN